VKKIVKMILSVVFSFWFLCCFSVFLSFVVAVVLYRMVFSGELSVESNDWGNFGGYIGGVFGPLISFVTLLAVLKTVYLQRELLNAQRQEFERMNVLQQKTFDAQLKQIKSSSDDSRELQVSASRDTAIKVIEQQILMHQRVFDRKNEHIMKNKETLGRSVGGPDRAMYQKLLRERALEKDFIDGLVALSIKIATTEYVSVGGVRQELVSGFESVDAEARAKFESSS
jgi:uncharacterized membrane protein